QEAVEEVSPDLEHPCGPPTPGPSALLACVLHEYACSGVPHPTKPTGFAGTPSRRPGRIRATWPPDLSTPFLNSLLRVERRKELQGGSDQRGLMLRSDLRHQRERRSGRVARHQRRRFARVLRPAGAQNRGVLFEQAHAAADLFGLERPAKSLGPVE